MAGPGRGELAVLSRTRLGVLIPCRDEAAVIERRIANLARSNWPDGHHRILVVDDHSVDDTRERASRALHEAFGDRFDADCIANRLQPGKAGAIATALDAFGDAVDLIVLTDADVVHSIDSLAALASAFEGEPRLGMACATQRFVDRLPEGACSPTIASSAGPAAAPWDRWTACARRFESRHGRLFSVHGQLMAWRSDLKLRPRTDVAADDLDLVLALRRLHPDRTVRLVQAAVFFEQKPAGAEVASGQAMRRARAYLQAMNNARQDRGLQTWCYRVLPLLAPRLALVMALSIFASAGWFFGVRGLFLCVASIAVLSLTRTARHIVALLLVIERARCAERTNPMPTRWEMQR